MNTADFSLPAAMAESFCSHSAVKAGDFKSSGTSCKSCFPFDVMKISFLFLDQETVEQFFNDISAGGDCSESAGFTQCFHKVLLFSCIKALGFSIADNSVPSLKRAGGFVCPLVSFSDETVRR